MPANDLGIIGEIAEYLENAGVGTQGSGIWVNYMPNDPTDEENDIGLYERIGSANITSTTIPDYTFQVYIRNNLLNEGYGSLHDKIKEVYDALHNKKDFLSNSKVTLCKAVHMPPAIFRDPSTGRFEASMDFTMTVKEIFD